MSLIDEVPEAAAYARETLSRVSELNLWPSERFVTVTAGVLSATSVDSQGETVSVEALRSMVDGIRAHPLWLSAGHDPTLPPIGRILAAELFYDPRRRIHFVVGISGIYAPESYRSFASLVVDAVNSDSIEQFLDDTVEAHIALNHHELDVAPFQEALKSAPSEVEPDIQYWMQKGEVPWQEIITVATTALAVGNPFSKALLTKLGEKTAESAAAFGRWVGERLLGALVDRVRQKCLFRLTLEFGTCEAWFLIATDDPEMAALAWLRREEGMRAAAHLAEQLRSEDPSRVVYRFDHVKTRAWLPQYVITAQGIIGDKLGLLALDRYTAMAIGSRIEDGEESDGNGGTGPK